MSTPTPILQYTLSDATMKGLLPAGYTPLAYIESTGTLYINTGYTPNINVKTEIEFEPLNTNASVYYPISCITTSDDKLICECFILNKSSIAYSTGGTEKIASGNFSGKLFIVLTCGKFIINGLVLSNVSNPTIGTSYNILVMGFNLKGSVNDRHMSCKLYLFKVWDNSTIKVHLIPAIQDSNGAIGMYDLVSRTFKTNAGSGTFIAGPPLAIGKGGGKSLPEEYLLVEYLEGTGTQWINTGYMCSSSNVPTLKYILDAEATDKAVGNRWWANGIGGGSGITFHIGIGNGSSSTYPFTHGTGVTDRSSGINGSLNTRYKWELDMNNSTFKVWASNGTNLVNQTFTKATPTQQLNLALFRWYSYSGAGYIFGMKIYHVELYNGSTKVVDLYPVYRKSDGKPGMYDVVRSTFYTNAGSGEFILGPTVNAGYTWEPNAGSYGGENILGIKTNGRGKRCDELTSYAAGSSGYVDVASWDSIVEVYRGDTFTVSFDAVADVAGTAYCYFYNNTSGYVQNILATNHNTGGTSGSSDGGITFAVTTNWKRFTISWTMGTSGTQCLKNLIVGRWSGNSTTNGKYLYIKNVKLLRGISNNATFNSYSALYTNLSGIYDSSKGWVAGFNGSNYVSTPGFSQNDIKSIALWVKTPNLNNLVWYCDAKAKTGLGIYSSNFIIGSRGRSLPVFGLNGFTANTWYHIAVVYNSTPELYINGVKYGGSGGNEWSSDDNNLMLIGTRLYNGALNLPFTGQISNFMIFDTALTAAQVKELYGQ